jgi:hypothetical protein
MSKLLSLCLQPQYLIYCLFLVASNYTFPSRAADGEWRRVSWLARAEALVFWLDNATATNASLPANPAPIHNTMQATFQIFIGARPFTAGREGVEGGLRVLRAIMLISNGQSSL